VVEHTLFVIDIANIVVFVVFNKFEGYPPSKAIHRSWMSSSSLDGCVKTDHLITCHQIIIIIFALNDWQQNTRFMATIISPTPIGDGQFDDVQEGFQDARTPHMYIDTYENDKDRLEQWSDSSNGEYDSEEIDEAYDDHRVEDEDWENAERGSYSQECYQVSLLTNCISQDFTKQYNRLRQHVAVRTGNAQGISTAHNQSVAVAPLPAVNHPRSATISSSSNPLSRDTSASGKDRTSDQLAALAKYNSRLAKIDVPYIMGVGVNRKGPSAHANLKDKSDRATNEQVLDPRTRLILFKIIRRGIIHEVNGCVSTGKEVRFLKLISK